jgi:predicted aspartyl protease
MRLAAFAFTCLSLLAGLTATAQAQQCGNLVRALSLDMQDHGGYFTVPVTINGQPKQFLLDTGGGFTQISAATTKQMGLTIVPSRLVFYDMYGNSSAGQTRVDVGIGPVMAKDQDLQITGISGLDGIFAADFMQNYDIDLDFAGKKLNYFLTNHCEGKVVYWPARVVSTVPFRGWNAHGDSHMNVTVKLDGHEVPALIDTGATSSTLDANTAHQLFNLTPDSPGAVPLGTMGTGSARTFGWTFKTLELGGLTVDNPRLRILPPLMGKGSRDDIAADSHIRRNTDGMQPTMLIGMDVLRKLHVFIAAKEGKLYLTAGSDQTTQSAPAAEVAH